jgi:SAM-dependent methyltransferase
LTSRAQSFDIAAEAYEQGRPGWPPAMLDLLPLGGSATVVDLGAGTGKLTRVLTSRYARVIAVEPLDGMRTILERELPEVEAYAGRAEAIPLADASSDGVFCGQSAHWFAHGDAVAEIARVLRRGGVLVAAWNEPDEARGSPLPEPYLSRLAEIRPPLPDDYGWACAVASGPFGPLREATVEHEHVSDREAILRSASSMSWIAGRDDRETIVGELDSLLPSGEYRLPLRTSVTWAVRR